MERLYFDLSTRTPEQIARIVSFVPGNWCWLDGRLHAPEALVANGKAHPHTGFILGGFVDGAVKVGTNLLQPSPESGLPRQYADISGLLCGNQWPAFICFDEAGYRESYTLPLPEVIRIVADYLRRGYESSHLSFFSGFDDDAKYENPERAEFHLQPWRDHASFRGLELTPFAELPPMLVLSWDARCGGTRAHLRPIIAACEAHGAVCLGDTPNGWRGEETATA